MFYSVSQKSSPLVFGHFFPNSWEFLVQILHTYYTFQSMLDYKFLFNYLQLWRSYAILRATTQFISYAQNVCHWPKCMLAFSVIFSKQLGIFSPNFTRLLHVTIGLHWISASANPKFGNFFQIRLQPNLWPNLADANATAVRSVSYLITDKN